MSSRGTKRRKMASADPVEDEGSAAAHAQANAPAFSAWSTRQLNSTAVLPLTTACLRVFAANFKAYSADLSRWDSVKQWLTNVPDSLIPRLLGVLREVCPTFLRSELISVYFLRGTTLDLGDDLPGVNNAVIKAIGRLSSREHLRELKLKGLHSISDDIFASVLAKLPSLRTLTLRECTKVAAMTALAVGSHCPQLKVVNLSYTAVLPVSLAPLLRNNSELEVLKVAGVTGWTDANVLKLWKELDVHDDHSFSLPNLRTLKLRQTFVTDVSVTAFLTLCPNLRRLDISFTGIRHPAPLRTNTFLEKLSLTSTKVSSAELLKIISGMTNLKTLAIGALGRGGSSAVSVSNVIPTTLTDEALRKLTDVLVRFPHLESINLAGNTKLGTVSRFALTKFISEVGRNCKILNLSGVSSLRSDSLKGLLSDDPEQGSPPLEVLVLNNTNVDDDAAVYISCCVALRTLELGATKLTSDGVFTILDACKDLESLNLTSCRGIEIAHRRNFFEAYENERS